MNSACSDTSQECLIRFVCLICRNLLLCTWYVWEWNTLECQDARLNVLVIVDKERKICCLAFFLQIKKMGYTDDQMVLQWWLVLLPHREMVPGSHPSLALSRFSLCLRIPVFFSKSENLHWFIFLTCSDCDGCLSSPGWPLTWWQLKWAPAHSDLK